jgi:hypothetical protein
MLAKFKTGTVEIGRPVKTDGAEIWDAPTITTTWTEIDAVATGVSQEYIDNTTIVSSDRMVLTQTPDFNEQAGDQLRIDGDVVAVLRIMPILSAGNPVAVKMIVRG